jgi:hypothetical protein
MATATKTSNSRSKSSKNPKKKKQQSLLSSLLARRYAKLVATVVAFMLVGGATVFWAMAATTTSSLWSTNTVPKVLASTDSRSTELGLRFRSDVAGYITGVKFYKSAQNTGTHTGSLWDNSGKLLASVTFANETASGWQKALFSKPVSIASGTIYVISYHAPNGHYSYNASYFSRAGYRNGPLHGVRNDATHPNGVYATSTNVIVYPTTGGNGTNYWVDVLFSTKLINPQPAPAAPTGVMATAQSSTSVAVNWQPSVSDSPIAHYLVHRNGVQIADVGTATSFTDTTVVASASYSYQIKAVDSNGANSVLSQTATVTTPASPSTGGGGTGGGNTGSTCPLPKYPDATCTGVPVGTNLTVVNGDLSISQPNTVIDGKDIRGCVEVHATGVVIKNSKISCQGPYVVLSHTDASLTIQDSEVDCQLTRHTAVGDTNITGTRLNIHGCEHGFDMDTNLTVTDSYIHDMENDPIAHMDGFLMSPIAANLVIRHNTIIARDPDGGDGTSAIITPSVSAGIATNILIEDNLMAGGAYTLYCEQGGPGVNYRVINNHFSQQWEPTVGAYGPSTDCSDETTSGNVYHESGLPVRMD